MIIDCCIDNPMGNQLYRRCCTETDEADPFCDISEKTVITNGYFAAKRPNFSYCTEHEDRTIDCFYQFGRDIDIKNKAIEDCRNMDNDTWYSDPRDGEYYGWRGRYNSPE